MGSKSRKHCLTVSYVHLVSSTNWAHHRYNAEPDKHSTRVKKRFREEKEDNNKTEKLEAAVLSKARRRLHQRHFLLFWKRQPDESMLHNEAFQQMLLSRKERGLCDDDLLYHPTMKRILSEKGHDIQSWILFPTTCLYSESKMIDW
jgi:hypothetical protein